MNLLAQASPRSVRLYEAHTIFPLFTLTHCVYQIGTAYLTKPGSEVDVLALLEGKFSGSKAVAKSLVKRVFAVLNGESVDVVKRGKTVAPAPKPTALVLYSLDDDRFDVIQSL